MTQHVMRTIPLPITQHISLETEDVNVTKMYPHNEEDLSIGSLLGILYDTMYGTSCLAFIIMGWSIDLGHSEWHRELQLHGYIHN